MSQDNLIPTNSAPIVKQLAAIAGALGYTIDSGDKIVPRPENIIDLLKDLRSILFPGYFRPSHNGHDVVCMLEHMGVVYWRLAGQIHNTLHSTCSHICDSTAIACPVMEKSCQLSMEYLQRLPDIQSKLQKDVQAAYDGDPAATNLEEIILSYPGVYAITVHRLAHEFHRMGLVLIARIMSEYAHSTT
ncbi:MAG: hypothetical protein GX322_11885, partial [Firmicutes bacterium]|nr:hypothetical protein [Bacillota bacterium]